MIAARHRRGAMRRAFTLVEMLVVIVILVIVVSLVVGVSRYVTEQSARTQTQDSQAMIITAIDAYFDVEKTYPEEDPEAAGGDGATEREQRSHNLFDALSEVQPSREVIAGLPEDATGNGPETGRTVFLDGWDNAIDYDADGGVGGTPELISPGPDGDYATEEDNIVSSGR